MDKTARKKPEKKISTDRMGYTSSYDDGYNQSHAEWTAYTDQLLKPLEDMLKKYTRINYHSYLGISATEILNEVQKVIENHKGEA